MNYELLGVPFAVGIFLLIDIGCRHGLRRRAEEDEKHREIGLTNRRLRHGLSPDDTLASS